jgi:hypothetical protein
MVELQIVILAVAGSSPVGHPARRWRGGGGISAAKEDFMLNPAVLESVKPKQIGGDFWLRLFNDAGLNDYDDLEKIVIGCEIIAALDSVELLAA